MPLASAYPADRAPPAPDEIGLSALLRALWRRKGTIAGIFIAAIALGVLAIVLWPVRYQASASILLDPRLGKTVGSDPATPGFVADTSAIDSQVKLLTSLPVLTRVADTLHLDKDPEFSGPHFGISRLLGLAPPQTESGADLKALENAITIKRPERTYLVEIQAAASTADKAAAIANAVAQAYNEDQISSRVVAARNDARFVQAKREQLHKQIEEAEKRIEAYKSENRIVSTDGLRSNEQQVADLTRELGASRGRLSDLKARADQVAAVARSGRIDATSDALKSATIERLRGAQADAEREVAKLAETLGPRHPALHEAQAQAGRVRDLIGAEARRLQQAAQNDYLAEKRNEAQLLAELERVKKLSTEVSAKQVPLRGMERELDALRQSDERFARIGDVLTQQEAETPPARIVAPARPPVSPAWPKRTLILAVSAAAGLFFGLGAALMREGARRRQASGQPEPAPARDYWQDERAEPAVETVAPPSEDKEEKATLRDALERLRRDDGASTPAVSAATAADPVFADEDAYLRAIRRKHRDQTRLVWS